MTFKTDFFAIFPIFNLFDHHQCRLQIIDENKKKIIFNQIVSAFLKEYDKHSAIMNTGNTCCDE